MVAFIAITTALALLVVTVYGLHRFQTMEVEFNVDRSIPLPPLDRDLSIDLDSDPAPGPGVQAKRSDPVFVPPEAEERPAKSSKSVSNWQSALQKAKESADLDQALAICQEQFPLWSAYNQACIVVRTQIGAFDDNDPQIEGLLLRLYRLAAVGELLHDKTVPAPRLTLNQLKRLDLEDLNALEFNYAELGYAHLRLLRKQDIKRMTRYWGKPEQHRQPREHHLQWWQALTEKLG